MYQDLSVPIAFLKELRFREFHLVMASANPDILYKFESMRTKWRRCFEEDKPDIAKTVRHFFGRQFYRKHKHSTYVIGELPEGIFRLKPTMYQNLKKKIEEQIEEMLPDVRPTAGATLLCHSYTERKMVSRWAVV